MKWHIWERQSHEEWTISSSRRYQSFASGSFEKTKHRTHKNVELHWSLRRIRQLFLMHYDVRRHPEKKGSLPSSDIPIILIVKRLRIEILRYSSISFTYTLKNIQILIKYDHQLTFNWREKCPSSFVWHHVQKNSVTSQEWSYFSHNWLTQELRRSCRRRRRLRSGCTWGKYTHDFSDTRQWNRTRSGIRLDLRRRKRIQRDPWKWRRWSNELTR